MNDCRTFKDLIEEYLDGTIGEGRLEELRAHMAACKTCAEEFRRSTVMQEVIADALQSQVTAHDAAQAVMECLPDRMDVRSHRVGVWATRARLAVAAIVLLAVGLIGGFVIGRRGPAGPALTMAPMQVARLDGTVLVRHEGSDAWQTLRNDSTVYVGDTFHCASGADLTLQLKDGKSTLELSENSMLALKAYESETRFFLEHGHCRASLESPHGPFFIETPHGRAEALGTEFTVTVE
ncbi:MAG: FecR domain-containing protein [Phycisphaerales bacterium]